MKSLNKKAVAGAVAAIVVGLVAATPAQAYVMASSMLNMTNFQILGSDGDPLDYDTDFLLVNGTPALTFTGTADQSVALTGFVGISNTGNNPPTNPINFAPICLGGGCNPIAPNDTLPKLVAPPASGNYSAADQYETGAPIANVPGFDSAAGADVGNGAYVGLDAGTVNGSADANNNLNSSFVFALENDQDDGITFSFDLDAFLQVAVTSDEVFPGFATASLNMAFTITDLITGEEIFAWNPAVFGLNNQGNPVGQTISLNAPLPFNIQIIRDTGGAIAFSNTTGALAAGTLYQASFRMTTEADAGRLAVSVPEPSILALMGMGLLGIGAARIRRRYA